MIVRFGRWYWNRVKEIPAVTFGFILGCLYISTVFVVLFTLYRTVNDMAAALEALLKGAAQ